MSHWLGTAEGWQPELFIVFVATASAAGVWGLGLLLASFELELGPTYRHSRTLHVAVAGVAWSLFWYLWSVRHLPRMLDAAGNVLGAPFSKLTSRWLPRLRSFPIVWTLFAAGACVIYVVSISHYGWKLRGLPFVDRRWVTGTHRQGKDLMLSLWATATMVAVIPNIVGVVKYSKLVHEQSRVAESSAETIAVAREGHKRTAKFGLITGLAWTAAVTAIVVLAVRPAHFDTGAIVVMSVLGLFGFALVFVPQWILHGSLSRMRDRLIDRAVKSHRTLARRLPLVAGSVEGLDERLRRLEREQTWIYGRTPLGLATLLVQLVLPLASFLVTVVVRRG